jgi:hypothetical protein
MTRPSLADLALPNKPHETTAQWRLRVREITDPLVMLATLCENMNYLGYDPYYKEIFEALWNRAEQVCEAQLIADGKKT